MGPRAGLNPMEDKEFSHMIKNFIVKLWKKWRPIRSSEQGSWLQIQRSQARFASLSDFLRSNGSYTVSTQPREDN
jgi:hypothetical protein